MQEALMLRIVIVLLALTPAALAQPAASRPATLPSEIAAEVARFKENSKEFGCYLSYVEYAPNALRSRHLVLSTVEDMPQNPHLERNSTVRVISREQAAAIVDGLASDGLFERRETPPPGAPPQGWTLELSAGRGPAADRWWFLGRDDEQMLAHPAIAALTRALDRRNLAAFRDFLNGPTTVPAADKRP